MFKYIDFHLKQYSGHFFRKIGLTETQLPRIKTQPKTETISLFITTCKHKAMSATRPDLWSALIFYKRMRT